jgi:pyruvate-formate lyase-activating enzyme
VNLVYADANGNVFDNPDIEPLARTGDWVTEIRREELIPLPEGATLVSLPGTRAVGLDKRTGQATVQPGDTCAVGALLPQGYTRLLLPGYVKRKDAAPLPLFGYTAVVWLDGSFFVAADATDDPRRWNPARFPEADVREAVESMRRRHPGNRLYEHLSHCALEYGCLTARNTFLSRGEGAVPVSFACNAECLGCISEQPEDSLFPSPQTRMKFAPEREEIVEVMRNHLQGPDSIISFGQGCEGEPTSRADRIAEAIRQVRRLTGAGYININTNAGLTQQIARIVDAGLDMMRVSIISALPEHYNAYYRPRGYGVEDVAASIRYARARGVYTSINYLVFPGVTDREEEIAAMVRFVNENGVQLIQMRNLNIDPEYYLARIPPRRGELLGMKQAMEIFRSECPGAAIGSYSHVPPRPRAEKR